jgi:signal transduction histidine kinase
MKRTAMKRAFRNLVENAVRYGHEAQISWFIVDNHVEIHIDDRGPGIPQEKLAAVFEPYIRIETSRSRDTGGHGLGLSIARSIVLEHGGSIELSNLAVEGLRATVKLPLELAGKPIHDEAPASKATASYI